MKSLSFFLFLISVLVFVEASHAAKLDLELETGGVWFSENNIRIPGDGGTKFDMLDLTGSGPDLTFRLYGTYHFNPVHALRLTLAPLETEGTGQLSEDVNFQGKLFTANADTKGLYRFNTYRLTYRWSFYRSTQWLWGLGPTILIRDAKIQLEQGYQKASKDDLGVVPLLHVYGAYMFNERVSIILDLDGAAAPQGRAIDAALKGQYDFPSGWFGSLGYRTLEGGADNDSVYTFAWLHYLIVSAGYRF
jgi:hypothetical protein